MDKFRALSILVIILLALWSTGCEILRTEQDAQGEMGEFTPPEAGESAPEESTQTSAVVQLQPATQQLNVGETTTVDLLVENVTDLFAVEIQVQFAPSVLQVQDADPNSDGVQISPGDLLSPDFVVTNTVDNTTGLVNYTVTQVDPTEPVTGSGTLVTFMVQAVAPGNSPLAFSIIKLATSSAQEIPTTVQNGQVTVGQAEETPILTVEPTAPVTDTVTPSVTVTTLPATATATTTPSVTVTVPPPTATPTAIPTATPIVSPTPVPSPTPTATPLPPLAQIPEGATLGFCYRVQKGQTLASIANEFNTTPQTLQVINDLFPPGYIYPQKALFIPTDLGSGPNFYVVQPGESLEDIAATCNLPLNFLEWVNDTRLVNSGVVPDLVLEIPLPPFPPPSRYPYPPSGPFGPPSVYPPAGFGPPVSGRPPCGQPRCGGW